MTAQMRTPDDLEQYVQASRIDARLIREIGDTPTVPAAAAALGVATDQILKTLLFLVERTMAAEEHQPVVVISHGARHVDKKLLADHFGVSRKRVKLAPPETVLDLLGYPAGGVPPFGHRTALPVIVDASIVEAGKRFDGVIYGGGGDDHTMLELSVAELLRVLQAEILPLSSVP